MNKKMLKMVLITDILIFQH